MKSTADAKKVFIKTYGCQMNVYDSERMGDILAREGYSPTEVQDEADLVVLNTCHIREKAAEKVYSEIGRLRARKESARRAGRPMAIVVAGCVAQAEAEEILVRAPAVDVVVGPQSYQRLPAALRRAALGEAVVETGFESAEKFSLAAPVQRARRAPSAFLTVQEGCDKFCTFCVVPYTRGAEISRPVAALVEEARILVDQGVREITLLGQNVNAYHGEGPEGAAWSLARLLRRLAEIEGLDRLRYTTSHPSDMTDDLIAAHRDLPALMPYLHLPVQSGSDRVLKRMNRRHSRDSYLALIDRIREARPDLALSGDFIVGFPGESEKDFQATLDLVERVGYAQAYSFKYSPRPGTPAADMADQIDEPVKSDRLQRLQALLARQQTSFNETMRGRRIEVLLERVGRKPGQLVGRSPWLQPVQVTASGELSGTIVPVEVTDIGTNSLFGRLLPVPAEAAF